MPASASDYFQKVGRSTATTLSSPGYTVGNTSINVGSTSNWPSDTGVTFAIDEVDSNGERIAGTYNIFRGEVTSATQISGLTYVGGDANRNYSAGATTRVYMLVSFARENRLVDGLLISHDQDGTLKAGAVDNAAVLASNVVTTAKILDANVTTAKLADAAVTPAKLLAGTGSSWAWQTYSPTLTNVTEGNGTKVAYYTQIGKTVHFRVRFVYGTTSSASGTISISLPVTASSNYVSTDPIGTAIVDDAGVATYSGTVIITSTTTVQVYIPNTSTDTRLTNLSNTKPSAPGNADRFTIEGTYEAA